MDLRDLNSLFRNKTLQTGLKKAGTQQNYAFSIFKKLSREMLRIKKMGKYLSEFRKKFLYLFTALCPDSCTADRLRTYLIITYI